MNVSDVQELFDYDRWANARVLAIASSLSDEQRSKPSAASFATVHGTLAHIFWSEWVWLGRWTPLRSTTDPRAVGQFDLLRRHWSAFESEQRTYLEGLAEADLDRLVSYQNPPGKTWTYSLRHMLQHVINHSTYHRGQLTTMFRGLGAAPRPLDFLDYFDEAAGAGR